MKQVYREIFFSTTKYVLLRNFFMVITGIVSIFIVRLLGPSEYGKYSLVWNLISTVGPILSLGWLTTLAKFLPEKTEQEKKILFSQSILCVLIFSTIFFVLGEFFISMFPSIIPAEIKNIKTVFLLFIVLVAFFNIFEGLYRGLGKFNLWTTIDGLRSNLAAFLALILLVFNYKYYQTIIFSNFLLAIIFILGLFYFFRLFLIKPQKLIPQNTIIKFSLTMFLGQIIFLLGTSIDSVLLRALLKDPAQVGFYNAGIRIPKMLETMLIAPLSTPFLYYFSHIDILDNKEKILEFGSKILGVSFGVVTMFLFSFAKEIVLLLFSSNYNDSIMVLRIFSLVLFMLGFTILISTYFTSVNKPYIPLISGIISFLIFIVFGILLIPIFKSVGAAISTVIGVIVQVLYLNYYLMFKYQVKCIKNYLYILFGILVSIMVGFCLSFYLSCIVFLVFVFITSLVKTEDFIYFKNLIIDFENKKCNRQ